MSGDGHGPQLQLLLQLLGLLARLQGQHAQLRLQRTSFRLAIDIAPQQAAPPARLLPDLRRVIGLQGQRDACQCGHQPCARARRQRCFAPRQRLQQRRTIVGQRGDIGRVRQARWRQWRLHGHGSGGGFGVVAGISSPSSGGNDSP